jgi:branched-chain amino acid transport system ATP-binding protein
MMTRTDAKTVRSGPGEPLIAARALFAGYGKVTIVRDFNLEVYPGEVVALVGPNGAGKTTVLRTMAGLQPPLEGATFFNGERTVAPLFRRARSGLGMVSEDRPVLMTLTVLQNLKVSQCSVTLALELFPDLEQHLGRRVGLLSGGQQRMVALARILSRTPSVLLADELSLGLAPLIVDRLLGEVRAAADRGVGVVLVEQHVRKALTVADRVVVLRRGRIALSGPASEFAERFDEIRAAYFESDKSDKSDAGASSAGPSGIGDKAKS